MLVDTPEGVVHVVNTHLGLVEHERHWQISRLLGHMLFRAADRLPTVIIGDFNDWRNTLSARLVAANGFSQVTSPASRYRTFPAWLAVGSLDKAFVRGPLTVRHARIVKTSLTREASDHLPLVVDFHLR